jgi:hypothetical protein
MPKILESILADGTYTPEELTEIQAAYLIICSDLGVAADDETSRETVAEAVIEEVHGGADDRIAIVDAVKARLIRH